MNKELFENATLPVLHYSFFSRGKQQLCFSFLFILQYMDTPNLFKIEFQILFICSVYKINTIF